MLDQKRAISNMQLGAPEPHEHHVAGDLPVRPHVVSDRRVDVSLEMGRVREPVARLGIEVEGLRLLPTAARTLPRKHRTADSPRRPRHDEPDRGADTGTAAAPRVSSGSRQFRYGKMKSSSQKMCPRYASPCSPRAGTPTSSDAEFFDTVWSRCSRCRLRLSAVSPFESPLVLISMPRDSMRGANSGSAARTARRSSAPAQPPLRTLRGARRCRCRAR